MPPEVPPGERGAALLTVLLLVAVIAVLAGGALERLRLATRLAGNAVGIEAERAGARMAEALALARIDDLLGRDPSRVTLQGGWSGRPLPLPLPGGGLAVARVTDGGNCFNLNGLVTRAPSGTLVDDPAARAAFARLMRLVGVAGQQSEAVAAAAQDWIDADQDAQPGGAEDSYYLGLAQPYRTAGSLMADVSELRAVSGVTPDLYARVRPWLCALPVAAPATANLNTLAPEQAPLVAAWLPDGTGMEGVRQALLRRPPDGFATPAAFWGSSSLAGASGGEATARTSVTTSWFALAVTASGPDRQGPVVEQRGLIDATHLPARLVSRQWGEPS